MRHPVFSLCSTLGYVSAFPLKLFQLIKTPHQSFSHVNICLLIVRKCIYAFTHVTNIYSIYKYFTFAFSISICIYAHMQMLLLQIRSVNMKSNLLTLYLMLKYLEVLNWSQFYLGLKFSCLSKYRRTSMARTPWEAWKYFQDSSSSS